MIHRATITIVLLSVLVFSCTAAYADELTAPSAEQPEPSSDQASNKSFDISKIEATLPTGAEVVVKLCPNPFGTYEALSIARKLQAAEHKVTLYLSGSTIGLANKHFTREFQIDGKLTCPTDLLKQFQADGGKIVGSDEEARKFALSSENALPAVKLLGDKELADELANKKLLKF